jgi:hypothetical protein
MFYAMMISKREGIRLVEQNKKWIKACKKKKNQNSAGEKTLMPESCNSKYK